MTRPTTQKINAPTALTVVKQSSSSSSVHYTLSLKNNQRIKPMIPIINQKTSMHEQQIPV